MKQKISQYTLIALLSFTALACGEKPLTAALNQKLEVAKKDLNEAKRSQIKTALSLYKLDNSVYPSTKDGLKSLVGEKYGIDPEIIKSFRYELKADGTYILKSL